jgi:hypothetical protein
VSLQEARQNRSMSFLRRGMRADMNGRGGVITSGDSSHLRMRFDGEKRSSVIHPWWQMTYYYPDGSIAHEYKEACTTVVQ